MLVASVNEIHILDTYTCYMLFFFFAYVIRDVLNMMNFSTYVYLYMYSRLIPYVQFDDLFFYYC